MSKAEDFARNSITIMSGYEAAADAANRSNREILKSSSDAELQEIVDKMRGSVSLNMLIEARESFGREGPL